MEEHISKFSGTAVKIKPGLSKKQIRIIALSALIIAVTAFAVYKYHKHQKWLEYMDKYYYPFIEKHGIDDYEQGSVAVETELEYEYLGDTLDFFVFKPTTDKFDFEVRLEINHFVNKNTCWNVSYDNRSYDCYFYASVDENDKWKFDIVANGYPADHSTNYDPATAPAKDDVTSLLFCFDEEGNYMPFEDEELTESERKILDEVQPQLKDLYHEMRYVILEGIA